MAAQREEGDGVNGAWLWQVVPPVLTWLGVLVFWVLHIVEQRAFRRFLATLAAANREAAEWWNEVR